MNCAALEHIFFSLYAFGEPAAHFLSFLPLLPLTEVSPLPSAIPGDNPPECWQSAVGWGEAGFEPRNAGQQSGEPPLSHHASYSCHVQYQQAGPTSGLNSMEGASFSSTP